MIAGSPLKPGNQVPGAPQSMVIGLSMSDRAAFVVVVEALDLASWLCLCQRADNGRAGRCGESQELPSLPVTEDTKLTRFSAFAGAAARSRPSAAAPMLSEIRNRVIETPLVESRG